jgi:hypothetical protein
MKQAHTVSHYDFIDDLHTTCIKATSHTPTLQQRGSTHAPVQRHYAVTIKLVCLYFAYCVQQTYGLGFTDTKKSVHCICKTVS